jgi:hypothetical protein
MRQRELPERACTDTRRRPTCSSHGVGEAKTGGLKTDQLRPRRPRAADNRDSDYLPQRLRVRQPHATPAWRGRTLPKQGGSRGAASSPSVGKQVCAHIQSNGLQDSAQWTVLVLWGLPERAVDTPQWSRRRPALHSTHRSRSRTSRAANSQEDAQ